MDYTSYCTKHGTYTDNSSRWLCPKCEEVRERDACVDCEQHKASVNFSESVLDYTHFGATRLCKCCYFKRIQQAYFSAKENYEKLRAELTNCEVV